MVLIVFDGTWRHAKEMVSASSQFLSEFAVNVYLDFDARVSGGTIYDSDLVLRKEPFGGCVSTIEAVARSLRVLEPEPHGAEVEGRLLMVLRAMVRFQACNLKPLKPRPKLLRKNGKKVEEKNKSLELSGRRRHCGEERRELVAMFKVGSPYQENKTWIKPFVTVLYINVLKSTGSVQARRFRSPTPQPELRRGIFARRAFEA